MATEMTGRWEDLVDRPEFRGHEVKITIIDEPSLPPVQIGKAPADLADRRDEGLSNIVLQVSELLREPEFDDRGRLRPDEGAVEKAFVLLAGVASVPLAHVSTDADGGLRINWEKGDKAVRLIIPPPQRGEGYIYHQDGAEYGVDENLVSATLAQWLGLVR